MKKLSSLIDEFRDLNFKILELGIEITSINEQPEHKAIMERILFNIDKSTDYSANALKFLMILEKLIKLEE